MAFGTATDANNMIVKKVGDLDTGLSSSAANTVELTAGGTAQVTATASATTVAGTLAVTGATTFSGAVTINSDVERPAGYSDNTIQNRVRYDDDFIYDAGATLKLPAKTQDTSAAGSPTLDFVADALNGTYVLTTDSTSEAQNLTLYFGDQLVIDPTKNPVFEARLKWAPAGATQTADERLVIGLAAARNATLDSNTAHAWFRLEGASLNILVEADDGTTDTNDQDSTIDLVKDTYTTFRIDMSNTSDIKFYVDGVEQGGATVAAAAFDNTMKLQPYIETQRDAGAEVNTLTIDYWFVEQDRV